MNLSEINKNINYVGETVAMYAYEQIKRYDSSLSYYNCSKKKLAQ